MPDPQSRHCPDFVAAHECGSGPSRQAAFFRPTVANGALRTWLDLQLAPAQSFMTHIGPRTAFVLPFELGWTEGGNVRTELRWAGSDPGRITALAKELADLRPDAILGQTAHLTRDMNNQEVVAAMPDCGSVVQHMEQLPCARRKMRSRRIGALVTDSARNRKQGPINFWKTTPYKVFFWVRFQVPQDKGKLASLSNCTIPSGVRLPPAAALRRSHTRGRRRPPFPRDSCVSWHTVNLRSAI
jgi:hypothetical protein